MASLGQTLFRFTGAMLLAAGATAIDNPRVMRDATRPPSGELPVVIAVTDIREGAVIPRSAVAATRWPANLVPPGAYASVDSVVGRVARSNVFRKEVLLAGRLAVEADGGIRLTPGKRAFPIRVHDLSDIAGMVRPDSRVDILVTLNTPGDPKQRMAKILMTNRRVLAFGAHPGQEADGQPARGYVVTIEASPAEIEKLVIAGSQGRLSLVLRGLGDPDSIVTHVTVGGPAVEYSSNSASVVPRLRRP